MADQNNDITFSYDIAPFVNAMNKMVEKMNGFEKSSTKSINKVKEKSLDLNKVMSKFAFIGAGIAAGVGLIKTALNNIPEIGTSFEAAGKIITRNLLWPLRQMLIPLLQKMLNWVRDNRSMFVKWGIVIANIFKVLKTGFEIAFRIGKTFFDAFSKTVMKIFNATGMSITDFINLMLFKIAFLLLWLEIKLRPFIKFLSETINSVVTFITDLAKAIAKGFGERFNFDKFIKFFEALGRLAENFTTGDLGKNISWFFKYLAEGIGELAGLLAGQVVDNLTTIVNIIDKLFKLDFKGAGKEVLSWFGNIGDKLADLTGLSSSGLLKNANKIMEVLKKQSDKTIAFKFGKELEEAPNSMKYREIVEKYSKKYDIKIDDGIITPDGKVIKTNPQDTIVATKNNINKTPEIVSKSNSKNTSSIKMENNINLTVTEGNAKQSGINFASGLAEQMYRELQKQHNLAGGI